ncbi:hypothetical protein BJ684DRAFT_21924, partial [Piptocephalis cylindrospora]
SVQGTGSKLTQPKSPQFHSRFREDNSSRREKMFWGGVKEKESEQGAQFKAHPVNLKVLQSSGDYGVPRIRRKEPTIPKSPAFSDRLRLGRVRDRVHPMVAPPPRRGGDGGPLRTRRPTGKKASPARVRRVMGLEHRYTRPTLSSRLKTYEGSDPLDHGSLAEQVGRTGSPGKTLATRRRLPLHIRSPRRIMPLTGSGKRPSPLSLSAPARRVRITQDSQSSSGHAPSLTLLPRRRRLDER